MAEDVEAELERIDSPWMRDLGPRIGAVALAALTGAGALRLQASWSMWSDDFSRGTSVVLVLAVAATLAAVFRGGAFARRCVAATLLLGVAGFLVARLGGYQPHEQVWGDLRYVSALLLGVTTAAVGLIARRRWARWLALSLSIAGAVSAGINVVGFSFAPTYFNWMLGTFTIGGGLIVVLLSGRTVADTDIADDRDFSQAWPAELRPVWWLRAAVLSALVAAPMLVLYAWAQRGSMEAFQTPAVCLAAALAGSTYLVVRGKAVGALFLGAVGLALITFVVLMLSASEQGWQLQLTLFYLPFWLPAGVAATASGAMLARAASRLLRED